jgi:hypothetical protein
MHLGLLRDVAMERAHKVEEKDFQRKTRAMQPAVAGRPFVLLTWHVCVNAGCLLAARPCEPLQECFAVRRRASERLNSKHTGIVSTFVPIFG